MAFCWNMKNQRDSQSFSLFLWNDLMRYQIIFMGIFHGEFHGDEWDNLDSWYFFFMKVDTMWEMGI